MAKAAAKGEAHLHPIHPEIKDAVRDNAIVIVAALGLSLAFVLLFLSYPFFMMLVFRGVIMTNSLETLIYLAMVATLGLVSMAAVDVVRGFLLARLGARIDRRLSGRVMEALIHRGLVLGRNPNSQAVRDLDSARQMLTNSGLASLLDLPWLPLFLGVIFLLHPALGFIALGGALLMIGMTIANKLLTNDALRQSSSASMRSYALSSSSLRNAEVIRAMGLLPGLMEKWRRSRQEMLVHQGRADERSAILQAPMLALQLFIQVVIVGTGAYLVLEGQVGPGVMFGAMILTMRALMPLRSIVTLWPSLVSARLSLGRVSEVLDAIPPRTANDGMSLPRPSGLLTIEGLSYALPGTHQPFLRGLKVKIPPGRMLGIVGPSGSGKSTLARLLIGTVKPTAGHVRLDGADVAHWDHVDLGRHLGYLPQDVELFEGTVAENIARFSDAPREAVEEAARRAGAQALIERLPDGYDTEIGADGAWLSGGQRQRIGLARALFAEPALVVLDEPDASLDPEGQQALVQTFATLRELGVTVVAITHRPRLLAAADQILVMRNGAMERLGPAADVLAALAPAKVPKAKPDEPSDRVAAQAGHPARDPEPESAKIAARGGNS